MLIVVSSVTAPFGTNIPARPLVVTIVVFCPGRAVPSPQSATPDAHCEPTPMKNLMGNVRSATRAMYSFVLTFFNCFPVLTTSTSAKPSTVPAVFTVMRYRQSGFRLSWLVCQLAWYAPSLTLTSEPDKVRIAVPARLHTASGDVAGPSSVMTTDGLSCWENTCDEGAD